MENVTPATLRDAVIWFADFDHCREFMVQLRWPDGVVKCPRCGAEKVSWLAKARVWKCYAKHEAGKGQTFTLKTGTIFEDSPIPLERWLTAAWLIISCKNGVSSYEIHRALGVTQKSAWFMLHRIRLAMRESGFNKIGGPDKEVEADETFVGGKAKNMHSRSKRWSEVTRGGKGKTVVLGLLERDGRVKAAVAPSRHRHFVQSNIAANVEAGSTVYTDEFGSYDRMPSHYTQEVINHLHSYVEGRVHTNGIENFWKQLKTSIRSTHVSVSPQHMPKYLGEFTFRANHRQEVNAMFDRLVAKF